MPCYTMTVADVAHTPDGWVWGSHGPYATELEACEPRMCLLRRVRARAETLGGYCWRSQASRWHVSLPDGVACGLPLMVSEACARGSRLPG